jgi:hypothetical protein
VKGLTSQLPVSIRGEHEESPGWKLSGLNPPQEGHPALPNLTRGRGRLSLRRLYGEKEYQADYVYLVEWLISWDMLFFGGNLCLKKYPQFLLRFSRPQFLWLILFPRWRELN